MPSMDKTFTARQWGWEMDVIGLVLYMKNLWPREAQLPTHKNTELVRPFLTGLKRGVVGTFRTLMPAPTGRTWQSLEDFISQARDCKLVA